ncbi:MAG: HEAT repeat domain-containing protein [candidate division KSB1 bacterium]|nr:HEAT repeat domain-containing protein [candidate division KSB1 bacterium]MDZ7368242.1 HEAT repeat domain-containing protein [candidate division KSB1 bacterium]MDZ7406776.1 HEAT repeat domain-containing protein [candidate division KSB1 bacterium]
MRFGHEWSFNSKAYAKFLNDDEQVHLQALAALLDRDEKTALPEIKILARQHENWAMRAAAATMLSRPESAEAISILEEVLNKDADARVRKAAVRALSHRDEPAAREALKRLLTK